MPASIVSGDHNIPWFCRCIVVATHNNCCKFLLALVAASSDSSKKNRNVIRGDGNMLDAIQISLALWAMIVCGGIKAVQFAHYLF
jgi:hypothetical protein